MKIDDNEVNISTFFSFTKLTKVHFHLHLHRNVHHGRMTSALTEIDRELPRVYRLDKPLPAWNVVGTSGDSHGQGRALLGQVDPAHARSVEAHLNWMQFWKIITGNDEKPNPECSFSGCVNQSNHGGHIYLQGQGGRWQQGINHGDYKYCYIAPICKDCNHPSNDDRKCESTPKSTLKPCTFVVRILMCQETINAFKNAKII